MGLIRIRMGSELRDSALAVNDSRSTNFDSEKNSISVIPQLIYDEGRLLVDPLDTITSE
jgi:hypothetical protein